MRKIENKNGKFLLGKQKQSLLENQAKFRFFSMLIGHELGDADMDGLLPQHSPTFQFENPFLINLSRTIGDEVSTLVEPTIGLFSGFSLIVGAIVGAGIFSSPGPVLLHSGGMLPSLVIWLLAGLLSLCGALSYAELGTAYPSSGGEHHYLMKAYGPIAAFLYSLTGVILVRPASQAIIFTVAGEYLYRIASFGSTIIYAVGLLSALTILNIISTKSSTATQDILTSLKLFVLLLIISLGFSKITTSHKFHLFDENSVEKQPGGYALAFYFALWAYDGWNNLNFITSELVDPANTLPTCISISMITVIVSYILANISYFLVLSIPDIQSSASLALDFGYSTLGKNAGIIIPIVVVLSAMGAANASLFTGSRLIVVVSQQGHIPEFLSGINKITKTPIFALGMQYFLCVAYIIVGGYILF